MSIDTPGERAGIDEFVMPAIDAELKTELNPLELEMYQEWREERAEWMLSEGKSPEFGEGYTPESVTNRLRKIDDFALWTWGNHNGFTVDFDPEQLDEWWHTLKSNENALSTNQKRTNGPRMIFKEQGIDWQIPNSEEIFKRINKHKRSGFTDWLSVSELEDIRTASLRVYGVPHRDEMTQKEEDEWAAHLAQRLKKPKQELGNEDWESANSYKIPSLVYASCDVGFRPAEVERATVDWFNLDDGFLKIPKEDSTKNSDDWRCYFGSDTVRLLKRWMEEREEIGMYDDTDAVWLTREGNPYSAESLRRPIMQNLMHEAGIDQDMRESGWYMIRRGVGTDLGTREGIKQVMSQLRIKQVETAMRYVRHDERGVRNWLDTRFQ